MSNPIGFGTWALTLWLKLHARFSHPTKILPLRQRTGLSRCMYYQNILSYTLWYEGRNTGMAYNSHFECDSFSSNQPTIFTTCSYCGCLSRWEWLCHLSSQSVFLLLWFINTCGQQQSGITGLSKDKDCVTPSAGPGHKGQTALTIDYHGESGWETRSGRSLLELHLWPRDELNILWGRSHPWAIRAIRAWAPCGVQAVCQQRLNAPLHLLLLMLSQYRSLSCYSPYILVNTEWGYLMIF